MSRLVFALFAVALAFTAPLPAKSPLATPADAIGQRMPTAILRTMPSDTPANQRMEGLHFIAGYEVIGKPVPLAAAQATRLASAIKSHSAFDNTQNEQHMRPGVAYRFGSGSDAVDLLVCFSCDKVAVIFAGEDTISMTYHITQATRDVLLSMAKELLPKDEAIQELPRIRSEHAIPPPPAPIPKDAPKPGQGS